VEARQDDLDAFPGVGFFLSADKSIDLKLTKEILGDIKVLSAGGWDWRNCWDWRGN
jgi:hypothetical protein